MKLGRNWQKILAKTFFFILAYFLEVLKFQDRFFLSFLVFHRKKNFFLTEMSYCLQKSILRSIWSVEVKKWKKFTPPQREPLRGGGAVNIGFSRANSPSDSFFFSDKFLLQNLDFYQWFSKIFYRKINFFKNFRHWCSTPSIIFLIEYVYFQLFE